MANTDELRREVRPFVEDLISGGKIRTLANYLTVNSNLPGNQPNQRLASVLAEEVAAHAEEKGVQLWGALTSWAEMTPEQAPTGSPREYLPYCGAVCIGALAASAEKWRLTALDRLQGLARDPRVHVREGVIDGLRHILKSDFLLAADEFVAWIESGNPYEMRAVGEAIAEPLLLIDETNAAAAMALHRALIDSYAQIPVAWRGGEEYGALRETLSHSLSVAVAALPDQGFDDMQRWAALGDPDLDWLLVQNLTRSRLMNVYQVETESLLKQLQQT